MIISNIKRTRCGAVTSWKGTAAWIPGTAPQRCLAKHVLILDMPGEGAIGKPTTEIQTAIKPAVSRMMAGEFGKTVYSSGATLV